MRTTYDNASTVAIPIGLILIPKMDYAGWFTTSYDH
jgi:hypothetical protein